MSKISYAKIDERVRRALLFMPGDDRKKILKGAALGIDTVIMDLEDAVALNRKEAARQTVLEVLTASDVDFGQTERLVRVNAASTGLQEEDLRATVQGHPEGYVLPKVESAQDVLHFSGALRESEQALGIVPETIQLLALIETAPGVVNLPEIAVASERLVALMVGAEDLTTDIGAVRSTEGQEIFYARSAVVMHAAAFGLQAIDTPYVNFRDLEGLRAETEQVMRMGYTGKLAIHPAQIGPIHDVFTPSDEEIEQARRLVAAHEEHQASGAGVFALEGKMVDMPVIRAAERVLARARVAGKT